jgi:transposase, IS5 family
VADSISLQRFCRVPLGTAVPHPTTLMKITTWADHFAVEGLNEALLATAQAAKVFKTNKVRADITVVPANVANPTDSVFWPRAWPRASRSSRMRDWFRLPGRECVLSSFRQRAN